MNKCTNTWTEISKQTGGATKYNNCTLPIHQSNETVTSKLPQRNRRSRIVLRHTSKPTSFSQKATWLYQEQLIKIAHRTSASPYNNNLGWRQLAPCSTSSAPSMAYQLSYSHVGQKLSYSLYNKQAKKPTCSKGAAIPEQAGNTAHLTSGEPRIKRHANFFYIVNGSRG